MCAVVCIYYYYCLIYILSINGVNGPIALWYDSLDNLSSSGWQIISTQMEYGNNCPSSNICWCLNGNGGEIIHSFTSTINYQQIYLAFGIKTELNDKNDKNAFCQIYYKYDTISNWIYLNEYNSFIPSSWISLINAQNKNSIDIRIINTAKNINNTCYIDNISILGTIIPTQSPTINPTLHPIQSLNPSINPTISPTMIPSIEPTDTPTMNPSKSTLQPTIYPSIQPTEYTFNPTTNPTLEPTSIPTLEPTSNDVNIITAKYDDDEDVIPSISVNKLTVTYILVMICIIGCCVFIVLGLSICAFIYVQDKTMQQSFDGVDNDIHGKTENNEEPQIDDEGSESQYTETTVAGINEKQHKNPSIPIIPFQLKDQLFINIPKQHQYIIRNHRKRHENDIYNDMDVDDIEIESKLSSKISRFTEKTQVELNMDVVISPESVINNNHCMGFANTQNIPYLHNIPYIVSK